ncbi:cytochrome P450 [Gymnopus androsaceus JB14]|uniref:Cytochrome P450 n=1 Tax=Gymnopus androsaceus JB14 TaxID=1447944 RepID=A0A6A4GVV9_9AGAR|nr:cytochrome P450 [Gymnopus androsaceus JB14]
MPVLDVLKHCSSASIFSLDLDRLWVKTSLLEQDRSVLQLLAIPVVALIVMKSLSKSKGQMPPGPRGLPFLGNIFQLPQHQWLRFTEWKEQYGPIFSLNMAGNPVIVLNSHEVVTELLEKRSTIYSDRPRFIMAHEILTGGIFVAFSGYNALWRKLRRAGQDGLNVRASEKFQPLQQEEARFLAYQMLTNSRDWDDHMRRSAASSILCAVYGWDLIQKSDDPFITRINDLAHRLVRAALPGAYLVEIFPMMLHLPNWMAKWKREGLEWHRKDTEMFEGFIDKVKTEMVTQGNKPSLAASLLNQQAKHDLSPKETAWLAGTMVAAGAETTAAALSVFVLAMILYPDSMRKAQREIDSVVGRGRLPTFADRPHLPYLQAMVKEVLRWRPVAPSSLPRRTSEDDWYNEYFIPKGTVVIANAWALNRDPRFFPDYDEFRPEHFLDENDNEIDIPGTYGQGRVLYGFGRRMCMGMHVANQALFIDMATILWAADINPTKDDKGNLILPSKDACVNEGIVVRPVAFPCTVMPRTADAMAMVMQAVQSELGKLNG